MIRIGLNGFGRIGRAVSRIILQRPDLQLCLINELDPDINNMAYLLKYDSIYGRFDGRVAVKDNARTLTCNDHDVPVYACRKTEEVPWKKYDLNVLVDATGVRANVLASYDLVKQGVPKVIITHAPPEVDKTLIRGVNEDQYDARNHHVISSSICDANALAPVLNEINKAWGIENCFVTTLHPWLSYQNLLDGFVSSIASPGHFWKDYSLGRASVMSLIPKDTTSAKATLQVLPELEGRLDAISFRVPTHMVSASDITVTVKDPITAESVNSHFEKKSEKNPEVFGFERDHLVSIDYLGTTKSVIVDSRRTRVLGQHMLKMVLWYDNEWAYSSRVVDLVSLIASTS